MKILVSLAAGLLLSSSMGFEGFLLGCAIGYLLWEQQASRKRMDLLEQRLAAQRAAASRVPDAASAPAGVDAEAPPPEPGRPLEEEALAPPPPEPRSFPEPVEAPADAGAGRPAPDRPPAHRPAASPAATSLARQAEAVLAQVRAFLFGGNTLVRLGMAVLFIGFAFLARYAADHDYFPLELRLAATAASGCALIGVGWRLVERRRDFALVLQGGGAAVLYLTTFVAFRLYGLLPSGAAFGLLVATTLLCGLLALLQNAQGLVILGLLGGFAAPVLTSTGEGSHVALFSYFALLNVAILVLAWYRAWRPLHLVGFFCTFGIAGLWVADAYTAALFATTEPFLVFFFLCYFAISILHSRHDALQLTRPVDGTLVFGLPVVVFSLQAVLVAPFPYGLAWSALAFAAFYAAAAYVLYRRSPARLRLLVESFAGVGLALATMVLPFAFDATWTGAGWALEAGALVWLGFRQRRGLLRASGMLLHAAAGLSFFFGLEGAGNEAVPLLNSYYFGCLALGLSALFIAFLLERNRAQAYRWEAPIQALFLAFGLLWWLAGGIGEIVREVADDGLSLHLVAVYVVATALLCTRAHTLLGWQAVRVPALLLLPALALLLAAAALLVAHPFEAGGFVAWPVGVAAHLYVLRRDEHAVSRGVASLLHAGGLWFPALLLAWEGAWLAGRVAPADTVWPTVAALIVPIVVVLLTTRLATRSTWPFGPWRTSYLLGGAVPLLGALWIGSIVVTLTSPADPRPLPFLPLINPLDLVLAFAVLAGIGWYRTSRRLVEGFGTEEQHEALQWLVAGTVFVWLNATLARTVHFVTGVPYDLAALLASSTFQTALTLFWTTLSVAVMGLAARRGGRTAWIAAATLLGVAVVKLFVVDLSSLNTVARIISFIVVGLLLLLVGYLAPVPPSTRRRAADGPEEPVETLV